MELSNIQSEIYNNIFAKVIIKIYFVKKKLWYYIS